MGSLVAVESQGNMMVGRFTSLDNWDCTAENTKAGTTGECRREDHRLAATLNDVAETDDAAIAYDHVYWRR